MARRRNYRRSYGGRRPYYSARSGGRRGGVGINLSMPFLAGAIVGYTDMDNKIPAQLVLGAASAPVRGMGVLKGAAQGVVFGNLIQQIVASKGVSSSGFQGI
jgi:hypothetical protein